MSINIDTRSVFVVYSMNLKSAKKMNLGENKDKTIYRCKTCGSQTYKWMGRCPDCGDWDTLVQEVQVSRKSLGSPGTSHVPEPVPIDSITAGPSLRVLTGMAEFDRVLGGGVVDGSLVLIGGDPGIGKSTLMLQVLSALARSGKTCLYVSGEESIRQLSMRGQRLEGGTCPSLMIVSETNLDAIAAMMAKTAYDAVVIDSIQTIFQPDVNSTPGSVTQIREAAMRFMHLAKSSGTPIFLVGHVTKVGAIAGPRIMEHMVDTVCILKGTKPCVSNLGGL